MASPSPSPIPTPLINPDRSGPPDRAVARQAAHWLVKLHDDHVSAADIAACARWRAAHSEHERAWQRAEAIGSRLACMPGGIALKSLKRNSSLDRRTVLKTILLLMSLPAGYVSYRTLPWQEWSADLRTAAGERRTAALADGSKLILNTASSVDVRFDAQQRLLILHAGEILIETARDPMADNGTSRPFIVQTAQGNVRALGTRFIVSAADTHPHLRPTTNVTVLQHAVEIRPAVAVERTRVIEAGQQISFTDTSIAAPQAADRDVAAWVDGRLIANGMRLDDFLAQLSRYRHGLLRCDPQVADQRITGAFQLDNTDGILNALPSTLPVAVLFRTRYWVTVVPSPFSSLSSS